MAAPAAEPVALGTPAGRWLVVVTVLASGVAFLDATAVQATTPPRRGSAGGCR